MSALTPALFMGHGSPMNAIADNRFSREWRNIAQRIPLPRAVLCVSAHWETAAPTLCIADPPQTIHDFYGFPPALHAVQYPAPGAPWLANAINLHLDKPITTTPEWGLDHGAWQVLVHFYPACNVPVAQLSLSRSMSMAEHFAFARRLRALRSEGVLILSSGNIVHNLRTMSAAPTPHWALEFDTYVKDALVTGNDEALIHFERAGDAARIAVPTREHYLPLLYAAAVRHADESVAFHTEAFDASSISMRSVSYGLGP